VIWPLPLDQFVRHLAVARVFFCDDTELIERNKRTDGASKGDDSDGDNDY
jgi:hypothetical protein